MNIKQEKFTITEIETYFSSARENLDYINFHKYRYLYLLNITKKLIAQVKKPKVKVLDVGPMFQSNLFRDLLPNISLNTLGENYPINHLKEDEVHYEIDLNYPDSIGNEKIEKHDIIIFSEVIEHLYTPPTQILNFLQKFLTPKGYIIIQTPNAVAIHKRIKMIFGIHPYDLLTENRRGHFREYTKSELTFFLKETNFNIVNSNYKNYFNNSSTFLHRAFVKYQILVPSIFRDGITIVGQLNK